MTDSSIPAWPARALPQGGFTLVELMITLVIIGILIGVALPSYRQYVIRSNRVDATSALLRVAANQERFYLQNNTYSADLADVGFPGGATTEGHYTLAINNADAAGFEIQATPDGDEMALEASAMLLGGSKILLIEGLICILILQKWMINTQQGPLEHYKKPQLRVKNYKKLDFKH